MLDPQLYKKLIYNALEKMSRSNLIEFTDYDGKDYIFVNNGKNGEYDSEPLSLDERLALTQLNLMKNEVIYMCRYDQPGGGVSYDLAKDKRTKMHDDRAYVLAMGAYALSKMRRDDLVEKPKQHYTEITDLLTFRAPVIGGRTIGGASGKTRW